MDFIGSLAINQTKIKYIDWLGGGSHFSSHSDTVAPGNMHETSLSVFKFYADHT